MTIDIEALKKAAEAAAPGVTPLYQSTGKKGGWVDITKEQYEASADWNRRILYLAAPQPVDGAAGVGWGYAMVHKTGSDRGFSWKYDDPLFSADWQRVALCPAAPVDFDSLETAHYEPFSNKVGGPRTAVWLDDVRALLAAAEKP